MLCKYIITYVVMAEAWISFIFVVNLLYMYVGDSVISSTTTTLQKQYKISVYVCMYVHMASMQTNPQPPMFREGQMMYVAWWVENSAATK